ncbi:5-methylcytosine rRNA methyltransferase NSUN4-like isoform X2 [Ostrea edulis]|uniref:5-methylcytosine rRNA methyltransferase NSUN4-like isoform X2 n=1 Tax=Ostrea edulis TaxID=37623 RepID=UPI0024AEA7E5|nr:5-methylcytosine rRNA methyltransferase NSUN4-like isoform X2 [Ostrea edulis]
MVIFAHHWCYRAQQSVQAKHEGSKQNITHALNHMEAFYKPVYKDHWPSIRISLLTTSKYCALLNNYHSQRDKVENFLTGLGTYNAMADAAIAWTNHLQKEKQQEIVEDSSLPLEKFLDFPARPLMKEVAEDSVNEYETSEGEEKIDPVVGKNTSLYDFIPTKRIYSEKEILQQQIVTTSTFDDSLFEVPVKVIQEQVPELPDQLKFFVYEKGNVSDFPTPKLKHGNQLGYYLMDAASLLPVVTLDIQENDAVLDLCAAPGGKTLSMLQTLQTENLTCNDASKSRLSRLTDIMKWYLGHIPPSISITKRDGRSFTEPQYDKVLVDVPCNTDRHVLISEDNNLFKPGRVEERLALPTEQKELLVAGIQSCKPGGTVVYSTCTLSPAQNDGVIQAAMEHLWKETDIDSVVIDLSYIRPIFRDTFSFFPQTKFGQLIIPTLSSNFGPMYICKIKRIR